MRSMWIMFFSPLLLYAMAEQEELRVYSYNSFSPEWGLGKVAVELFDAAELRIISAGDTIDMIVNAASFEEGEAGRPDIVLGISSDAIPLVRELDFLQAVDLDIVPQFQHAVRVHDETLVPYDFGYIAFVYDSQELERPPESLEDLTDDRFARAIILMDPRTSGPGLAFLYWTIAEYGTEFLEYWRRLAPSILTISDSWSSAYGLFTAGEAPLVLSFTTSPAYHRAFEEEDKYKFALFPDGHYLYVEYLAMLRNAEHEALAKEFIRFVLSEDFQKEVPLGNIMYPVIQNTPLPAAFSDEVPEIAVELEHEVVAQNKDQWIADWVRVMSIAP